MLITAEKVSGGGDARSPASSATACTAGLGLAAPPPPAAVPSLVLVGVGATSSLMLVGGVVVVGVVVVAVGCGVAKIAARRNGCAYVAVSAHDQRCGGNATVRARCSPAEPKAPKPSGDPRGRSTCLVTSITVYSSWLVLTALMKMKTRYGITIGNAPHIELLHYA